MTNGLSYRDAGVDIEAGNSLVENIKPFAKKTLRPEVIGGLGGFGALFAFPHDKYQQPILVSATDGVGTKLKLAIEYQRHETIGIDLVGMNVNDVVVIGAEPLFFLDYFATGKLDVDTATTVIAGIAAGCEQAGCALIGGETAEMPGMYHGKDYDLAGFCVGAVEKSAIADGKNIIPGDVLIGLNSSGPHSNGYSLIRKILSQVDVPADQIQVAGKSLLEQLLAPTCIYVKCLLALHAQTLFKGAAHITGGGFQENIPRMLPTDVSVTIDCEAWSLPPVFQWLREKGQIETDELLRTFNCGIGMILAVSPQHVSTVQTLCQTFGHTATIIGQVENSQTQRVNFQGQLKCSDW